MGASLQTLGWEVWAPRIVDGDADAAAALAAHGPPLPPIGRADAAGFVKLSRRFTVKAAAETFATIAAKTNPGAFVREAPGYEGPEPGTKR